MAGTSICGSRRDDVRTQFSFGRQSACQQHGTHYGLGSRDGGSGSLEQTRRAAQHDQSRHHHDTSGERRALGLARRRISAHDRAIHGLSRRAGTPDEVGNVAALLMGPDGLFITGSDFLMDGGVTAAYWYGDLAPA